MKAVLLVSVLLAATLGVSTASATYICAGDAPYLPGALSQYYDMWNNIWRYYTCGSVVSKILRDVDIAFQVVLP